ncbi:MAG: glycosyltransferase [Acidobacteriota bacterium]|nr:glycosyltransferase [Acidobacteriota bacterium]
MRVALYYPWVYLTSGAERTILELTGRSRHRWTIFTNRFDPTATFPGFGERDVVELGRVPVKRTAAAAARGALRLLFQRLPLQDYDALVVVCEGMGDLVALRNRGVPAMCILLTPLRAVFDEDYRRRCLAGKSAAERALIRAGSCAFRLVDRLAWRRYRRVVAISSEAARRAVTGGLVRADGIEVVHPGLGFEPAAPSPESGSYFLLPGRIMWTKNIELGIQAFLHFRETAGADAARFRLVIAGIVDTKSQPYFARLRAMAEPGQGSIEFRVHPSDAEMASLYAGCYATLFTAFNEDWGIVPLESMAFGKPVIAVNRGGPSESVIHEVNGLLEEPTPERFASAMLRLVQSPSRCRELGEAGHLHSKRYSWTVFADRIDGAVESLARRPLPRTAASPEESFR